MELEIVEGKKIVDDLVDVAGKDFRGCVFVDCVFYYRRGEFMIRSSCLIIGNCNVDLPLTGGNATGAFVLGLQLADARHRDKLTGVAGCVNLPRIYSSDKKDA